MELTIDFSLIHDWDSFHSMFSDKMGFPDFYGRNMNAWIDCMSFIDDPKAGMSKVTVVPNDNLDIVVVGTENMSIKYPEILQEFFVCTSFVNQRFIESGASTRIRIVVT